MTVTIGRRELLAALGGAAAWPLAARVQQGRLPLVGVLKHRCDLEDTCNVAASPIRHEWKEPRPVAWAASLLCSGLLF